MSSFTNLGKVDPIKGASKGLASLDTNTNINIGNVGGISPTPYKASSGGGAGLGMGLANSGLAALSSVPNIIATSKIDPSEGNTSDEVRAMLKAKQASYMSSGMELGGAVGSIFGPIGGLIGTGVGAIGGAIIGDLGKEKEFRQFHDRRNKESNEEFAQMEEQRLQNYLDSNSSDRIKKEMDLLSQSEGYFL